MQSVFVLRNEASIFRVFFSISKFCWFTHFSLGERNSPLSLWMRKNYFFLYQEVKFTFAFTREKKLPLSLLWREIHLCLWRRETNICLHDGVRLTPNSMRERDLPWFGSVCRAWRPRHCGGGSWRHIRPLRPGRTGSWTSLYIDGQYIPQDVNPTTYQPSTSSQTMFFCCLSKSTLRGKTCRKIQYFKKRSEVCPGSATQNLVQRQNSSITPKRY